MIEFDRADAYDLGTTPGISKPVTGFAENFFATRENLRLNDQSQSKDKILKDLWGPIVEDLNEAFPNQGFLGRDFEDPGDFLNIGLGVYNSGNGPMDRYNFAAKNILEFMDKNQESLPENLRGITLDSLEQTALERAKAAREFAQEIGSRSSGFSGTAGSFLGGVAGVAEDPVNAFGIMGMTSKTLWRLAMTEAVIGAGTGAMAEAGVSKWYKEQGLDYGYQDFLKNVGINAVASAGFGVGLKVSLDAAKGGYNAVFKSGKANKNSQALADAADAAEELEADNPFTNANQPPAQAEHNRRAETAEAAVENNKAPAMTDEPTIEPTPEMIQAAADNLDGVMFKIPARDVTIDAKRFQFKEGGDEYGVTERLQGVTEWDPVKAGTVIFWEDAQGKVFIADGHQRAGLARRIMDQKPDQDISLIGYKLRETDDISAEKARVIAAVANIAQGTGTVIDAAKVLRVEPGRISELPPRSSLVSQAKDLVNLTDDAFGAIVNQVIPANYGAIVGRLIDDPELQAAAIKVLSKSDPSNAFQAEAIVRQVRETDMVRETQVSLFGDEDVATSLYTERAKVLDRTVKLLRADKASFENLSKNAERIEAEGNKLAKDQNQRRADQDGQAITLLQALANRKGTLSDDLSAAAREAKDQGYAAAARNFAEAVRRGVERGDFDRAATGDVGRAVDVAPEGRAAAIEDEPTLEGFDEPTGPAVEAQTDQMAMDMFRTLDEPEVPDEAVALAIRTPDQYAKYLEDGNYTDEFQQLMLGPVGDRFNVIRAVFDEDPDFALDEFRTVAGEGASQKELGSFKEQVTRLTQDLLKDFPDQVTVYRAGDVKKGEVQSYTLDPQYDVEGFLPWRREKDQPLEAYTVNKSDIVGSPDITRRGPIGEGEVLIDGQNVSSVAAARSPIEEDRVELEQIRMPIDDDLPLDQVRAQVKALTDENVPLVKDLIARIDAKFGTKSGDNIKDLSKVTQKANRPSILAKKPWHKVSHIRDSYRFKTVIDDIRDVPAIFDELLASGISLVKVDTGKLFEPKEWGWRIIAFDLRMPNGQLVEWYLPIKELEAQKKAEGHLLFEEWRNKTPEEILEQNDAYMETIRKSWNGYDKAFQSSLDRMGISREDAAASWSKAESSMLEAARKSPSSSGMITSATVRGAEIQEPSIVRMAEEPSVQKIMARDVPSSISAKSVSGIEDTPKDLLTDIADDIKPEDFDLEIPLGTRFDEETGELLAETKTLRDIKSDIDAEDALINRLGVCGL